VDRCGERHPPPPPCEKAPGAVYAPVTEEAAVRWVAFGGKRGAKRWWPVTPALARLMQPAGWFTGRPVPDPVDEDADGDAAQRDGKARGSSAAAAAASVVCRSPFDEPVRPRTEAVLVYRRKMMRHTDWTVVPAEDWTWTGTGVHVANMSDNTYYYADEWAEAPDIEEDPDSRFVMFVCRPPPSIGFDGCIPVQFHPQANKQPTDSPPVAPTEEDGPSVD
jgi:hypothetical protein